MEILKVVYIQDYEIERFVVYVKRSIKIIELKEKITSPLLVLFEKAWGVRKKMEDRSSKFNILDSSIYLS